MNLAPRERIYMADKTVCRWFDSTLPTNIINFKIMEQTFKDRIYNKLVNSILDDINCYPYSSQSPYGEFFPFVDKNKWGEYEIDIKVKEVEEDDDDEIYKYLKVEIDKLEVFDCIYNNEEIKRKPLNVDKNKVNELVNQSLYDDKWDITIEVYEALEDNAYQDYEGED